MSLFSRLFSRDNPNEAMRPLYNAIVAEGRNIAWYESGDVPDSLDGRFDMIAAILCLVLINLEKANSAGQQSAWLTELFVTDMDGQLRQIGIGDMIVGKHISKIMGAVGGRMGAYREALENDQSDDQQLKEALVRNVYRGEAPEDQAVAFVAARLRQLDQTMATTDEAALLAGDWSEAKI